MRGRLFAFAPSLLCVRSRDCRSDRLRPATSAVGIVPHHGMLASDAQPSRTAPMQGTTAIARQRKLERTGYHRSRPNNNTRHVPRLRGAWRLGAGAGIFLSLLSRHRDCAFSRLPFTAQVTASARPRLQYVSYLNTPCSRRGFWLVCLHPFGNLSLCHPN